MTCCREMFAEWLRTEVDASWDQLLEVLRSSNIQLIHLADQIEREISDTNSTCGKEINS